MLPHHFASLHRCERKHWKHHSDLPDRLRQDWRTARSSTTWMAASSRALWPATLSSVAKGQGNSGEKEDLEWRPTPNTLRVMHVQKVCRDLLGFSIVMLLRDSVLAGSSLRRKRRSRESLADKGAWSALESRSTSMNDSGAGAARRVVLDGEYRDPSRAEVERTYNRRGGGRARRRRVAQ